MVSAKRLRTHKGQITIPIAMRRALGITDETLLQLSLEGDRITISKLPLRKTDELGIYSDEELAEYLEADRIPPEVADWARNNFGRPRRLTAPAPPAYSPDARAGG
jgi:bifunctional DNA-binding transcriptional regulator/antitoxin component of YhaV-PrlF toxin-antitoxin module